MANQRRVSRFSKTDRSALAEAHAGGKQQVVLAFASRAGENGGLAADLTAVGASIRYREDEIGYVSAIVPIEHADEAARLPRVHRPAGPSSASSM